MYSAQFIGGPLSGKRQAVARLDKFHRVSVMPKLSFTSRRLHDRAKA